MFCKAVGWGVSAFPDKCYEGVRFNVTTGWLGGKFPGKKHNI